MLYGDKEHEMTNRTALVTLAVVLSLITFAPSAMAQEDEHQVTLSSANIEIDAGETNTVTAEYEFAVESVGSGESSLTAIEGTMWKISGRSVGTIETTVNGDSVEPNVTDQSQHTSVSVSVDDIEDGDTVTVQLEYEVSGPTGDLQVPLWVPEYSTAGETSVVHTTATFPDGTYPQGDSFPDPSNVTGNTATYDTLHTPGFIKVSYDDTPSGLITLNSVYSTAGVLLILGLVVGGLYIDRRTGERGDEK